MSSLLYSLNGIGVTAEVVNKLSSIMATHLRKVLRIYEHGVTNLAVLDQDGLQPLQLLHNRALRLQQSIQNDHNRSAALKHLEAKRAHTIVLQIEAHQAQPDGLSIQYVAKEAVCAIECPICGLAYGTPEGLYPCISTIGIRKCSNSPGCTSVAWIMHCLEYRFAGSAILDSSIGARSASTLRRVTARGFSRHAN